MRRDRNWEQGDWEHGRHGGGGHCGGGHARHGGGRHGGLPEDVGGGWRWQGRGWGGRRARRGDVRAAVLALLAERPMHGYEIIKELEERTGGLWRPSAGSVYPTLAMLEDEGLIAGEHTEGRRRFALTDEGRAQAAQVQPGGTAPWDTVTAGAEPERIRVGGAWHELSHAIEQVARVGTADQQRRVAELLDATRTSVYGILGEQPG